MAGSVKIPKHSQTGLVLTGGTAALLFAYTALYLAVALQSVGAGLERITPSIGGAAPEGSTASSRPALHVPLPISLPETRTR